MDSPITSFATSISQELQLKINSVQAVINLLDEGNTIPFIARYRKEVTGNLDEVQIKLIQEKNDYLKEIEQRRLVILASIESQGKLSEELKQQIINCTVKTTLEDLYLPFKPKRRTRAMIAREKGLEPLAQFILEQSKICDPSSEAVKFVDAEKGVKDINEALAGARDIVAEKIADHLSVRQMVRQAFNFSGIVVSKVRTEKANEQTKFEQYYDFKEKVKTIPSHRYLAIRRGEREEILDLSIEVDPQLIIPEIEKILSIQKTSLWSSHLKLAIEDSFKRLLAPSIETEIRLNLKQASDEAAVDIFADNLKQLLLSSPLGSKTVIGIDPGIRTGCKCAVVDSTGKYLTTTTIYLSQGDQALIQAKKQLMDLVKKYQPFAIAVGNGTAGRETEEFVKKLLKENSEKNVFVVSVNESGASIYSASDIAREEFPELDLTIRGAISIARRLQDPLAELVKIDPKSIGVGQYQHDVHQPLLQDRLHHVVESCVNFVGVNLNTASASLLSYVSGIGPNLAGKIVKHRDSHGPFFNRKNILDVSGFGLKTYEQSAGFLRILNGSHPLDASAVHPERYDIVEQMAEEISVTVKKLLDEPELTSKIDLNKYQHLVGAYTLNDIIQELKKPGRDPRTTFEAPQFKEGINSIEDLSLGLRLEGIITNVTAFGAFVDIGVHQDGLIHLSELSDRYIKHPSDVVKVGQKILVEVLEVDPKRKRISLTARLDKKPPKAEKIIKKEKPNFNDSPFAHL
ncbi:MAG: Tex family protein [Parachlamydiaceae bacterium]|nr:Tex family protein [Parachlamydiaceae bacterium]